MEAGQCWRDRLGSRADESGKTAKRLLLTQIRHGLSLKRCACALGGVMLIIADQVVAALKPTN